MEGLEAELLVAGSGHREQALRRLAELIGVNQKVEFAGFVDSAELGDYYRAADVFVSPSMSEPFGLTITEALSCGTPVVSTGAGALELASSGALEVERNSDAIRNGVRKVLEAGPDAGIERREWRDVAEEYEQIYSEAISSTRSTSPG
jgi:glycosyltransferase involved in cell wall biosynthesis